LRVSDTPCHAVAAWVAQSVRGSNVARSKIFFLQNVQSGTGLTHPDSCGMATGGRSTVVMRPGRETDKSPAPSNEDKNGWSLELSWAVAAQCKENLSLLCRLIELYPCEMCGMLMTQSVYELLGDLYLADYCGVVTVLYLAEVSSYNSWRH